MSNRTVLVVFTISAVTTVVSAVVSSFNEISYAGDVALVSLAVSLSFGPMLLSRKYQVIYCLLVIAFCLIAAAWSFF